jgi:hypothetical protein
MALARRHAAARPQALGFLHVDGHLRAHYGTRDVRKPIWRGWSSPPRPAVEQPRRRCMMPASRFRLAASPVALVTGRGG